MYSNRKNSNASGVHILSQDSGNAVSKIKTCFQNTKLSIRFTSNRVTGSILDPPNAYERIIAVGVVV
jgi:hypothetical protein